MGIILSSCLELVVVDSEYIMRLGKKCSKGMERLEPHSSWYETNVRELKNCP
jgi:hypothetical protein